MYPSTADLNDPYYVRFKLCGSTWTNSFLTNLSSIYYINNRLKTLLAWSTRYNPYLKPGSLNIKYKHEYFFSLQFETNPYLFFFSCKFTFIIINWLMFRWVRSSILLQEVTSVFFPLRLNVCSNMEGIGLAFISIFACIASIWKKPILVHFVSVFVFISQLSNSDKGILLLLSLFVEICHCTKFAQFQWRKVYN